MAINPTFEHTPVLSKVQVGDQIYYYKDLDLRAIVSAFGNATAKDAASAAISDSTKASTDLASVAQVYNFVKSEVSSLEGAMHFIGIKAALPEDGEAGDVVVVGTKEYVYGDDGWKELGDEGLWVPNTRSVAGLALSSDITVTALQEALQLKALAYAATASATVDDYVTGLTGASYTPAGDVTVASSEADANATLTTKSYTPAGSVAVEAGTAAAASYDKTTSVTVATAAATGDGNYTPSGSVTVTNVTVTPDTGTAATVTDAGTGYTITDGSVSQAADTKSTFATEGVKVAIDETDSEMLVISDASTSNAVTAVGAVTYTAPVLSGALPTFGTQNVVTGIASASGTASFSGNAVDISATPNTTATDATVTQPTFTAKFTGTAEADAIVTGVSYKKTTVGDATFEGTAATIAPTLVKDSKTITVTPDA